MKKSIIICLLLISVEIIQAQPKGFYYYSRIGLGVSNFNNSAINNQTGKLAINAGIAGNYQFNNYFGIVAEADFVSKGSKIRGVETNTFPSANQAYEDIYKLFYAEIPVLIKISYPITEAFYVKGYGGISTNFNLLGTTSRNYDDVNEADQLDRQINGINLLENAIVYGFGFEIKDKDDHLYSFDFRTSDAINSLGNIKNSENNTISGFNHYYTIGFGYSF